MKEQVGFKSIKDSCEGRERGWRRAFFGLQRGRVKGGALWEMCSLSGQVEATGSARIFIKHRFLQKKEKKTNNPYLTIRNSSLHLIREAHGISFTTPLFHLPPGTCSRFVSAKPSPSLPSASPPLIGVTATSRSGASS